MDNRNNRKNGRNIECHEVTYNKYNRDYLCLLWFSAHNIFGEDNRDNFSVAEGLLSPLSVLS